MFTFSPLFLNTSCLCSVCSDCVCVCPQSSACLRKSTPWRTITSNQNVVKGRKRRNSEYLPDFFYIWKY